MKKTEYKKTELLDIIKAEMKELEDNSDDIESGYFNESDFNSFYNYLLSKYKNVIVSVKRYHRSARIGTIIAEEPVPL